MFDEETVATYTYLSDGMIQVEFVIDDFDHDGRRLYSSRKACIEQRSRPFQTLDRDDDHGDLRQKFRSYLTNHGGYNQ